MGLPGELFERLMHLRIGIGKIVDDDHLVTGLAQGRYQVCDPM